tara:strand:- start:574 stop:771 length:198 start_codon:yes stop_codon:yes gene_type:complete
MQKRRGHVSRVGRRSDNQNSDEPPPKLIARQAMEAIAYHGNAESIMQEKQWKELQLLIGHLQTHK